MRAPHNDQPGRNPVASATASWWYLLLVVPFVALLWVPFYNRAEPSIFAIPFFYWYQFLWVILTSLLIIVVDVKTRHLHADSQDDGAREGGPQ